MLAKDIGTARVIQGEASQSLREAARIMHHHQVSCLVVVGEEGAGGPPLGMITERDVMTAMLVFDRDPDTTLNGSAMALLTANEVMTQVPCSEPPAGEVFFRK